MPAEKAKPEKPARPKDVAYSMFINTKEYCVLKDVNETNAVIAIDPITGAHERINIAQLEDIVIAARKQQRMLNGAYGPRRGAVTKHPRANSQALVSRARRTE